MITFEILFRLYGDIATSASRVIARDIVTAIMDLQERYTVPMVVLAAKTI